MRISLKKTVLGLEIRKPLSKKDVWKIIHEIEQEKNLAKEEKSTEKMLYYLGKQSAWINLYVELGGSEEELLAISFFEDLEEYFLWK